MRTQVGAACVVLGVFFIFCPHAHAQSAGHRSGRKSRITPSATNAAKSLAADRYGRLPLSFEANQGQAEHGIDFLARGTGYEVSLTANSATLVLHSGTTRQKPSLTGYPPASATGPMREVGKTGSADVLQMKILGANSSAPAVGVGKLPGKINYFIGNDPKRWRTNVPTYAKVKYQGVYRGVDLVYYGKESGQLEYDFVVAPGTDPKVIALSIDGNAKPNSLGRSLRVSVDSRGDLVLRAKGGDIRFEKPVVYQESAGGHREYRDGHYVLASKRAAARPLISFAVGDYDHSRTLVIDPAIVYSTYLGGMMTNSSSSANGIAVFADPSTGHVYSYVTGRTCASDFPTVNAEQALYGGGGCAYLDGDVFVTKFDPAASGAASVIYSTYLGGSGPDDGNGIAVDSDGNAYITGTTNSTDFPLTNAYQSALKSASPSFCEGYLLGTGFVAKISSDGSTLMYSTYFGGSGCDTANAIALDSAGRAYIGGGTISTDLPTVNPFQSSLQSARGNAFVAIFDTTRAGSASLLYSSYFGGSSAGGYPGDEALAIAVDTGGAIHLAGHTTSANIPVVNGFQTSALGGTCTGDAAFYARLTPSGVGAGQLLYSTYLGGCGDVVNAVAVDSSGDAYLAGSANSGVFPVTESLGSIPSGSYGQVFASKINPLLTGSASLVYSTIVAPADRTPGHFSSGAYGIAVDTNGDAFVAGAADPGMPLVNPVQESANGVMQSVNGGQSWTGLTNGLTEFPIVALAVDPSTSPRTLYAASCGACPLGSGNYPGLIFVSNDGGLNWTNLFQMSDSSTLIFALAVDPTNPSNVYAATSTGILKSSDRGSTWSAFNAGLSSSAVQGPKALLFDGGTLYAGAVDGLYVMIPGSSSWIATTLANGVASIAVDPTTNPHAIYTGGILNVSYKSTDGGQTWTSIGSAVGDGGGLEGIEVDTTTIPSTLYGFNANSAEDDDPALFKSSDGGNTWVAISLPPPDLSGDSDVTIDVDETKIPSSIYVRDKFNGVFESTDGGNTWSVSLPTGMDSIVLDSTVSPATVYTSTSITQGNAFIVEVNPSGSAILFSTYLGGVGISAGASGIALDSANNAYVTGSFSQYYAALNTFPAVNAYQSASAVNISPTSFVTELGSPTLPASSGGPVTTQVGVQTGTLAITLPNISGSTTSSQPTLTITPLSSTQAANFSLSNNLGAYDISTTASYSGSITLCFQALTVNDSTTFSNLQLLHVVNGTPVNITSSRDFNTRTVCGSASSLSPFVLVSGTPTITWNTPASIVYGTPLSDTQLNATANIPGTFTYTPALGAVVGPGTQTLLVTFTPNDTNIYSAVAKSVTINVFYATGSCDGGPGHGILPPINADGSSVFKLGSTVPTKFRVCDANGNSVGLSGTVASYNLIAAGATAGLTVDEQVYSTSSDTAFRWDSTDQQWIFNQGTGKGNSTLSQSNTTYVFRINLNDGTYIQFQYGLK